MFPPLHVVQTTCNWHNESSGDTNYPIVKELLDPSQCRGADGDSRVGRWLLHVPKLVIAGGDWLRPNWRNDGFSTWSLGDGGDDDSRGGFLQDTAAT
jgi:hypothetical protein